MDERVLGVLAGRDMPPAMLLTWALSAEIVIAADSGADRLLEAGFEGPTIIGDMDSASRRAIELAHTVVRDERQDETDCDKLLRLAAAGGHRAVTLVSVEGDLPDHELATLNSAARCGLQVRIAYRRGIGWILKPGVRFEQDLPERTRVSLMPIASCSGVRLGGVHWPLEGAALRPDGLVSISNRSEGRVTASLESGAALLFIGTDGEPVW